MKRMKRELFLNHLLFIVIIIINISSIYANQAFSFKTEITTCTVNCIWLWLFVILVNLNVIFFCETVVIFQYGRFFFLISLLCVDVVYKQQVSISHILNWILQMTVTQGMSCLPTECVYSVPLVHTEYWVPQPCVWPVPRTKQQQQRAPPKKPTAH